MNFESIMEREPVMSLTETAPASPYEPTYEDPVAVQEAQQQLLETPPVTNFA